MDGKKVTLSKEYFDRYRTQFEKEYEKTVFKRQESGELHNSVEWGNWVYECLKTNNTDGLIQALQGVYDRYSPGKLSEDDLRSSKNLVVSLISTLANEAARDRIVDNELALTAADVCILLCEKTNTREELLLQTYAGLVKLSDLMKQYREREYHPLVKQAKEYVYQHLHEEILIRDVAAALHVSLEHLSRTFHQAEGITLKAYILEERIARACNLLRYSEFTVSEISRYLAFSSQSHFTECFKEKIGKTPTEYRRDFYEPVCYNTSVPSTIL